LAFIQALTPQKLKILDLLYLENNILIPSISILIIIMSLLA
jgi:hypothetical protein